MSSRRRSLALALTSLALALTSGACGDDSNGTVADADVVTDTAGDTGVIGDVGPDGVDGGDTSVPPVDVSVEVAACKAELAAGQSFRALKEAEAGLDKAPDDPDALFCAALAGMIDRVEFSLSLGKVLDMASTYTSLVAEEPSYGDELAEEIHGIFAYLHAGFALGVARLDAIGDRPLTFDADAVWVYNGPKPMLVYRGRFDQGDVQLMRVYGRFTVGVLDVLRGQDLRGDIATLAALIVEDGLDGGFGFDKLLEILAYLTATDERFLTLHPEEGVDAFLESREVLARLGPELRAALAAVESLPSTPGVDEVTSAELMVDDGYRLTIKSRVDGDAETPIEVEVAGPVLDGLEAVSRSVREPGTLVPWAGGMTHLLAIMIEPIIETRALGDLTLGGVTLAPGIFTIDSLANLLAALVPSPAAFDLGTFYANPVGLRALLPRSEGLGGFGADRMIAEWECPDDLDASGLPQGSGRVVCSDGATLVDGPHFAGTADALAADGYASGFAYFAWNDPTWNGLLWADLSEVLPDTEPGYQAVDATTINVVIGDMIGPLLNLAGGQD
ncbi:MAG: hypothetical protein CVU56_03475 [Deltaproteobacteria bacterium HGW-Deltaproteobacteria-14]|jgi:hypothetical protein|nr:MAG: hypothetical protein CVU56_03475 [Deltaproteobacteria bacterium HGW-Deltaproteobacteria-14]